MRLEEGWLVGVGTIVGWRFSHDLSKAAVYPTADEALKACQVFDSIVGIYSLALAEQEARGLVGEREGRA